MANTLSHRVQPQDQNGIICCYPILTKKNVHTSCFSTNSFKKKCWKRWKKYKEEHTQKTTKRTYKSYNTTTCCKQEFFIVKDEAWGRALTFRPHKREGTQTSSSFTLIFPARTIMTQCRCPRCWDDSDLPLWVPVCVNNLWEMQSIRRVWRKKKLKGQVSLLFS